MSAASEAIGDEELIARARALAVRRDLTEKTKVGSVACVLMSGSGALHAGLSIDAPCSLGFCAEHNAVGAMITAGESRILTMVAIKRTTGEPLPPCGRCRELVVQIDPANFDARVLMPGGVALRIRELLPEHWQDYVD